MCQNLLSMFDTCLYDVNQFAQEKIDYSVYYNSLSKTVYRLVKEELDFMIFSFNKSTKNFWIPQFNQKF